MEQKLLFLIALVTSGLLSMNGSAQTETESLKMSSDAYIQDITPVEQGVRTDSYYEIQQQAWQGRIAVNQNDANAWLNYYKAFRFSNYTETDKHLDLKAQEALNEIVVQMNSIVPNTFETKYANYWNSAEKLKNAEQLKTANSISPERDEIYDDLIGLYEMQGNDELKASFCAQLNDAGTIPETVMTYNANVLNSVEQNGVLITNGYDDTWPVMIQQEVNNIRTDVKVVQLDLMQEDQYRNEVSKDLGIAPIPSKEPEAIVDAVVKADRPVYLGLTLSPKLIIQHQDKLYMTGLALRYSEIPMDNASLLKANWAKMELAQVLKWKPTGDRRQDDLMRNYIVPLAVLEDIYASEGNDKEANKLGKLLDRTTGNTGDKSKLKKARAVNTY